MLSVAYEEVELRVLLHLDAELIESLDRCVAGEEILWAWTEGDDFQTLESEYYSCHRNEVVDHCRDVGSCSHRILRDIAFQVAHAEVIRAVEHSAVCVATAVDHVAVALSGSHKHAWSVEFLGDERLWSLRSEVAEEHHESVASCCSHLVESLEHVGIVLNGCLAIEDFTFIFFYDILATLSRQFYWEAVTADGDDAQFHLWDVSAFDFHKFSYLFLISVFCQFE